MNKRAKYLVCIITIFICAFNSGNEELGERSPFQIPLVKMKLAFDKEDHVLKHVQISIDENNEYVLIARSKDIHVINTNQGRKRIEYPESADRAFIITDFEAKHLNKVVKSLILTLDILEKDLKRERWDRCRYLDAYLPKFLNEFYYLVCAARNSQYAMPRIARIPDSEYDVSLKSPKTDARIQMWRKEKDHIIKLRIISKELIFQLKNWQKKELANPTRNLEIAYSAKAEEAYGLFIKIYFNLKPQPEIPDFGDHL